MAELPSGTVTFVFTDIEGSTRLFQRVGRDYEALLDEHRRLLRSAFEQHGGHEVATEGDSFFVAFDRASDAMGACLAGQRALAEHSWPRGRCHPRPHGDPLGRGDADRRRLRGPRSPRRPPGSPASRTEVRSS